MTGEIFSVDFSLWTCVWQSTIFIAVGLLGSFLLRRRSSRAHRVLFLSMVAAVIVPPMSMLVKHYELGMFISEPPLLESPAVPLALESGPQATVVVSADELGREPGIIRTNIEPAMAEKQAITLPWRVALLYGWLGASLILMIRLVVTFALGVRLLHRARPLECEKIKSAVDLAKARVGIGKDVKVYASEKIHSPVIWCWRRRPILLLSSTAGELNSIDWTGVISHELAHWKRRDYICGLLAEVIACILPWHPLLWWSKYRLITLSEQACDDWVVATGHSCADYADSLLNLTPEGQMAFVPAVVSTTKDLSGRVRRILTDACSNPQTGVIWAVLVSVMVACVAIGCAFMQTRPAETEASTEQEVKHYDSLTEAAKAGDLAEVKRLIAEGADLHALEQIFDTPLGRQVTPLVIAAEEGHVEIVKVLLNSGAKVDIGDSDGSTPLFHAVFYGHKDIAELLIDQGADVNAMGKAGEAPLLYAALHANKDLVSLLISNGADVNLTIDNTTPLRWATQSKDLDVVKLLVDNGAKFDVKDTDGDTALHYAAFLGRRDIVEYFISKGADASGFHMAAFMGDLDRVQELIKMGTEIDQKDEAGWTALFWAACSGQTEVAEFLIDNNADISAKNDRGQSLLHRADQAGAVKLVELLISKGADVNAKNGRGNTLLHSTNHKDVAELLISKGADVNAEGRLGITPFFLACQRGNMEVAELLIDNGADIHAKNRTDQMPLHSACQRGNKEVAEFLIDKGADINAKNIWGMTPLRIAAERGHTEIVELLKKHGAKESPQALLQDAVSSDDIDAVKRLISQGADVNAKNRTGQTPLHSACQRGNKEVAEFLIDKGADINAKDRGGMTPLHLACQRGNKEIAEFLIDKVADINSKNRRGMTPLHLACQRDNMEVTEFLIVKGADINAKNGGGMTPLHLASYGGHKDIVELLIAKGADVNATNNAGNTPLDAAEQNGHTEIVELLKKHGAKE